MTVQLVSRAAGRAAEPAHQRGRREHERARLQAMLASPLTVRRRRSLLEVLGSRARHFESALLWLAAVVWIYVLLTVVG